MTRLIKLCERMNHGWVCRVRKFVNESQKSEIRLEKLLILPSKIRYTKKKAGTEVNNVPAFFLLIILLLWFGGLHRFRHMLSILGIAPGHVLCREFFFHLIRFDGDRLHKPGVIYGTGNMSRATLS